MPWNVLILLGGGFAIAKATKVSGLSLWFGAQFKFLAMLDKRVMALIIYIFTSAVTEVTSNVIICSVLLPILRDLVSFHKIIN